MELLELGCVGRVEDGNIMLTEMGEFVAEFPLLEPALSLLIASGTVFNRQNSMRMLAAALMIDPPCRFIIKFLFNVNLNYKYFKTD